MLKNYIDGKWTKSSATQTFPVINPATEEELAQTPLSKAEDVERAVYAAHQAFLEWRQVPCTERIQYLFRLKTLLEANLEELSYLITREHGKTLAESRGSIKRAIQMVETACSMPTLMMGQNFEDISRGIDCSTVRRPMGVFAGIAPFNFPAMVPFWFWPFAIASGNTYVLKPSERVPLTSMRVFELLEQTGLPKGVMNMVHGDKTVVDALLEHKKIKGISFVGSTPVAKYIYQTGAKHGKRVQALGGAKNLMVVAEDALEGELCDKTVSTALESIIGCAGERCLAGSLILCIGKKAYKKMQEQIVTKVKKIRIGDGAKPETDMGPLISKQAKERVCGLIERAIKDGAHVLFDGREPLQTKGFFLAPTVLSDINEQWEIAQEEIFGPVILLAQVESLHEAIAWINRLPLANTTTLFTNKGALARQFAYSVDPSMIGINIGVPAPMSFFSFGGSKESFFGDIKAHGQAGVEFFTDTYTTIYRWYSDQNIW